VRFLLCFADYRNFLLRLSAGLVDLIADHNDLAVSWPGFSDPALAGSALPNYEEICSKAGVARVAAAIVASSIFFMAFSSGSIATREAFACNT
jgi:hypothetical protein